MMTYWKKLEKTGLNVHAVDGYMRIVYIMTLLLIPVAGREYVPTVFCRLCDVFFNNTSECVFLIQCWLQ